MSFFFCNIKSDRCSENWFYYDTASCCKVRAIGCCHCDCCFTYAYCYYFTIYYGCYAVVRCCPYDCWVSSVSWQYCCYESEFFAKENLFFSSIENDRISQNNCFFYYNRNSGSECFFAITCCIVFNHLSQLDSSVARNIVRNSYNKSIVHDFGSKKIVFTYIKSVDKTTFFIFTIIEY